MDVFDNSQKVAVMFTEADSLIDKGIIISFTTNVYFL
jgi:hypothetical protein